MNIGSDYTERLVGEWKECRAIKRRHDTTRNRVVGQHDFPCLFEVSARLLSLISLLQQTQMALTPSRCTRLYIPRVGFAWSKSP